MLRIAHLNLSKDLRGGERQTIALIEAIAESVDSCWLRQIAVVRKDSRMAKASSAISAECELRPVRPNLVSALRGVLNADLIHVHEGRGTQVGALASLFGIPFVVTRRIIKRPKDFFLTRWCYRRADRIACVSSAVAGVMRQYQRTANLGVVPDCARQFRATDLRSDHAASAGKVVIGSIGELDCASKGQHSIIDVARKVIRTNPEMEFWFIGAGKDESHLRTLAQGLENVRFLGWTNHLEDYLARIDILAHPANNEGLGSVILEAMSFSIPVVAADAGGIPELVIHGFNGLLVETGNPNVLSEALMRLSSDAGLRATLGQNAKNTAARFSMQRMAKTYCDIYAAMIEVAEPLQTAD